MNTNTLFWCQATLGKGGNQRAGEDSHDWVMHGQPLLGDVWAAVAG